MQRARADRDHAVVRGRVVEYGVRLAGLTAVGVVTGRRDNGDAGRDRGDDRVVLALVEAVVRAVIFGGAEAEIDDVGAA